MNVSAIFLLSAHAAINLLICESSFTQLIFVIEVKKIDMMSHMANKMVNISLSCGV